MKVNEKKCVLGFSRLIKTDNKNNGFLFEASSISSSATQLVSRFHQWINTSFLSSSKQNSLKKLKKYPPLRLSHFRFFSALTRSRLLFADRLIEELLTVFIPIGTTFAFVVICRFALVCAVDFYQAGKAPLQVAHLLLETVPLMFAVAYTLKKGFLFLKLLFLTLIVWYTQAREVEKKAVAQMQAATMAQFAYFFKIKRKNQMQQQNLAYMAASGLLTDHRFQMALGTVWTTTGFMREHCRLLVDLVLFNQHFASRLIFWFFLPMIIGSVFLLCTLYFLPVYFLLKLYMYFLYSYLFIFFAFFALLPMVPGALYHAHRHLFSAQMKCRTREKNGSAAFLRTKLKLMSYYEVLRTKKQVTFTFGSLAKVDNRWLSEVNVEIFKFFVFF